MRCEGNSSTHTFTAATQCPRTLCGPPTAATAPCCSRQTLAQRRCHTLRRATCRRSGTCLQGRHVSVRQQGVRSVTPAPRRTRSRNVLEPGNNTLGLVRFRGKQPHAAHTNTHARTQHNNDPSRKRERGAVLIFLAAAFSTHAPRSTRHRKVVGFRRAEVHVGDGGHLHTPPTTPGEENNDVASGGRHT